MAQPRGNRTVVCSTPTIYRSKGKIPESFLRAVLFPIRIHDTVISTISSNEKTRARDFQSHQRPVPRESTLTPLEV